MFINTLITISGIEINEGKITSTFTIDPKCKVFEGHFPGNPILPGVLELQITESILFESLLKKGRINNASNIKFLKPIFPDATVVLTCEIDYTIENQIINCSVKIKNDDIICMTMLCSYLTE